VSLKLIRRAALLSLLLPFLYFGTASAAFLFRTHADNSARLDVHLNACPVPDRTQRLLVFAPHPDDEALGCAGLLQQAARAGAAIRVVMLTNGDGFRVAVERQFRMLRVGPADHVRFAAIRQEEARRALAGLGVRAEDVKFLGYPDRGLMALWNDHWAPDRPYVSLYTRRDHSPYEVAFRKGAVYCGQSLLADIKALLRESRPTHVYVTHPSDDHPDHSVASAFVTLALRQLRQEGAAWAQGCNLHYYLVHRGDWPIPQGLHRGDQLVPPREMISIDTRWRARPLNEDEVARKTQTILAYPSQTAVMKRFLVSFARQNELFGEIDPARIPRVPDGMMTPDGSREKWANVKAAALDPVNDSLLRDFQAGGDVKAIYACRDTAHLYLRVDTYQPPSRRVEFRLRLRYFGDPARATAGGTYAIRIQPPRIASPADLRAAVEDDRVEVAIPLREIGYARYFALSVETSFAGIQVDRTGYRFLDL